MNGELSLFYHMHLTNMNVVLSVCVINIKSFNYNLININSVNLHFIPRDYYYLHFTGEEIKTQNISRTCPASQS